MLSMQFLPLIKYFVRTIVLLFLPLEFSSKARTLINIAPVLLLNKLLAAALGFEPRQTESESAVLPLHNAAITNVIISQKNTQVKNFILNKLM